MRAVPEGHVVFAGEPLLEVTAPLPQAQLGETYLLNQLRHQTVDGGALCPGRGRTAGRGLLSAPHARPVGGSAGGSSGRPGRVAGTSNVAAAAALDFPASGTMAHSYGPVRSESLAQLTGSARADIEARLRPQGRVAPSDTAVSRSVSLSAHTH